MLVTCSHAIYSLLMDSLIARLIAHRIICNRYNGLKNSQWQYKICSTLSKFTSKESIGLYITLYTVILRLISAWFENYFLNL